MEEHRNQQPAIWPGGSISQDSSPLSGLPAYYSILLDQVHDAIIGVNQDLVIEYWNKTAAELFGWTVEEVIGKRAAEVLNTGVSDLQIAELRRKLEVVGKLQFEGAGRSRAGLPLFLKGTAVAVKASSGAVQAFVIMLDDITEQKKLLNDLASEKARLKAIVEQTPAGIVVADAAGEIILANKQANLFFAGQITGDAYHPAGGYSLHHPDGSVFTPEELPLPIILREKAPTGSIEIVIKSQKSQDRIVDSKGAPFFDDLGNLLGALVVLEDVTEHRNTEHQIQENEERLKLALEAAHMVAWEWNLQENELKVTGNFAQLYGAPEPQHGEDAIRLVHREDRHEHLKHIKQVLGGAPQYHSEFRIVRLDTGEIAWVEEWCISVIRGGNRVQKLIGVARDITEQKRNQQMLETSLRAQEEIAERFRASVESLLDGYAILSSIRKNGQIVDFRYEYINDAGCRMNNRTYAEQVGHTLLELLPGHTTFGLFDRYVQLVETGRPVFIESEDYEDIYGGKRLRRTFEVRAVKLGDGFVVTWRDISDRKRSQEKIKRYAEKLRQSNQDLERFAFIASHDLQEPLRKIKRFGENLQRSLGDQLPEDAAEYLTRMQNAVERMTSMINGLLELSRVNTRGGNFEPIDLAELAEDVVSDLEWRLQATKGQVILNALPVIEADALQMRQLLQNLIANALKFHQPGTPPVVKITGQIVHEQPEGPAHLLLKVEDNGIGFDMEQFERILQPFQRLHGRSEYEGTGIGLAICKQIVERHHGRLEAQSQPGQGAVFLITLPVQQIA